MDTKDILVQLDTVSPDPLTACKIVKDLGINKIVLRNLWSTNITRATPKVLYGLLKQINDFGLSVPLIVTDVGKQEPYRLSTAETDKIRDAAGICNQFKCKSLAFRIGKRTNRDEFFEYLASWVKIVDSMLFDEGITPVIEIHPQNYANNPVEIIKLINDLSRIRLLFNPASIVAVHPIDPFIKYWVLFKNRIKYLELSDHIPGVGIKMPGKGKCRLKDMIIDSDENLSLVLNGGMNVEKLEVEFLNYYNHTEEWLTKIAKGVNDGPIRSGRTR